MISVELLHFEPMIILDWSRSLWHGITNSEFTKLLVLFQLIFLIPVHSIRSSLLSVLHHLNKLLIDCELIFISKDRFCILHIARYIDFWI